MNVYKIEVLVIDFDELGEKDIKEVLENANFPNDCLSVDVKSFESRQVDWDDGHPLNKHSTCEQEYARLFNKTEV